MKKKATLLTCFIMIILLIGGLIFWKIQNDNKKLEAHLNQTKKELLANNFFKAKQSIKKAKRLHPKSTTVTSYKNQINDVISYQSFVKESKLEPARQSIRQLESNSKLVPELKDYVSKEKSMIEDTKEKINIYTLSIDQAKELHVEKKYEESNKALTEVMVVSENPFLTALLNKAKTLKKQNNQEIKKASNLEKNKVLSQEEAENILKTNLPDYFNSANYTWLILTMENDVG